MLANEIAEFINISKIINVLSKISVNCVVRLFMGKAKLVNYGYSLF